MLYKTTFHLNKSILEFFKIQMFLIISNKYYYVGKDLETQITRFHTEICRYLSNKAIIIL